MARAPQQVQRSQEDINEAAEQSMLAAAMGFTEREIFEDAMALPEDEDDGDRSLEAMDEDFVGNTEADEVEEEAETRGEFVDPAGMHEVDPLTGEPVAGERGAAEGGEAGEAERLPPHTDQPSWLRASDQQIDPQIAELRERLARAEGALSAQTRVAPSQPAQPTAPTIPDPVVDPEGFHRAQEARIAGIREQIANQMRTERLEENLKASFGNWENNYRDAGRQDEFYFASQVLDRMSRTGNPNDVRIVRAIVQSPDPARTLMQWAEDNLDMESVRDQVFDREDEVAARALQRRGLDPNTVLEGRAPQQAPDRQPFRGQQSRGTGDMNGQQRRQAPRQSRLPSLNSAPGGGGRMGGNSRNLDPRGFDGGEASIFDYAMQN